VIFPPGLIYQRCFTLLQGLSLFIQESDDHLCDKHIVARVHADAALQARHFVNDRRMEAIREGQVIGRLMGSLRQFGVEGLRLGRDLGVGRRPFKTALVSELVLAEYSIPKIRRRTEHGAAIPHLAKDQAFANFAAESFGEEIVFYLCHNPFFLQSYLVRKL
jgi:hypothetical protein